MIEEACTCKGYPPHSHQILGWEPGPDGVMRAVIGEDDVRIWVDWKAVARDLMVNP